MQDNWPQAIEAIALLILIGTVSLGWLNALPWQNRKRKKDDD